MRAEPWFRITGWVIRNSCARSIWRRCWWRLRSFSRAGSGAGCGRLDGISRTTIVLLVALVSSACHRPTTNDLNTISGRCSNRARSKGVAAQLPGNPSLRPGFGGVIGTLSDAGGALPHYSILASIPGDAPGSPHATATADSVGGFVFSALPPGHYRLLVRAFAHRPDSADIDVVSGRVDTVRLSPPFFQCVR